MEIHNLSTGFVLAVHFSLNPLFTTFLCTVTLIFVFYPYLCFVIKRIEGRLHSGITGHRLLLRLVCTSFLRKEKVSCAPA